MPQPKHTSCVGKLDVDRFIFWNRIAVLYELPNLQTLMIETSSARARGTQERGIGIRTRKGYYVNNVLEAHKAPQYMNNKLNVAVNTCNIEYKMWVKVRHLRKWARVNMSECELGRGRDEKQDSRMIISVRTKVIIVFYKRKLRWT